MEKITKDNWEQFCEDEQLDEDLYNLFEELGKLNHATAEVNHIPTPDGKNQYEKAKLTIEIVLFEP